MDLARRMIVGSAVAATVMASCSRTSYSLPERTNEVVAAEADLAKVVGTARGGDDCTVRYLGEDDRASFVWAECAGSNGAVSGPARVEGDDVEWPGDGSQHAEDVRRMFPKDIADAISSDAQRLRP